MTFHYAPIFLYNYFSILPDVFISRVFIWKTLIFAFEYHFAEIFFILTPFHHFFNINNSSTTVWQARNNFIPNGPFAYRNKNETLDMTYVFHLLFSHYTLLVDPNNNKRPFCRGGMREPMDDMVYTENRAGIYSIEEAEGPFRSLTSVSFVTLLDSTRVPSALSLFLILHGWSMYVCLCRLNASAGLEISLYTLHYASAILQNDVYASTNFWYTPSYFSNPFFSIPSPCLHVQYIHTFNDIIHFSTSPLDTRIKISTKEQLPCTRSFHFFFFTVFQSVRYRV